MREITAALIGKLEDEPLMVTLTYDQLKGLVKSGSYRKKFFSYPALRLSVYRLNLMLYPFQTVLLMRLLSRGKCVIEDRLGKRFQITLFSLFQLFKVWWVEFQQGAAVIEKIRVDIGNLKNGRKNPSAVHEKGRVVYLRTDLWFGLASGGSIGHVAGVVNFFQGSGLSPIFFTTDTIPTVGPHVETHLIQPDSSMRNFPDVMALAFQNKFLNQLETQLVNKDISFLYQRYSLNNFAGVQLARKYQVPLVLEYNGSEQWIRKNWGWGSLKSEELTLSIEMLNLNEADIIVVVSKALEEELIARGINPKKILVNPNGVDVESYRPDLAGGDTKEKLNLQGKTVVGFMGTFGPWHGADVLARSAVILFQKYPLLKNKIHFLFIGDGAGKQVAEEIMERGGAEQHCTFVGQVDQEKGPAFLAACDMYVSPHVPNSDGSTFFGSPTKLFEYMSMGRAIVASKIGQLAEILTHGESAWLVKPGDAEDLAKGIKHLIDEPSLCARLGQRAREEVVAQYSWEKHGRRIIEKLKSL